MRQRITERECNAWRNRIVSIDNRDRRHVPRRYRRSRTSVAPREPRLSPPSPLLLPSEHIAHCAAAAAGHSGKWRCSCSQSLLPVLGRRCGDRSAGAGRDRGQRLSLRARPRTPPHPAAPCQRPTNDRFDLTIRHI